MKPNGRRTYMDNSQDLQQILALRDSLNKGTKNG